MKDDSGLKPATEITYHVERYRLQNQARKLLPGERVSLCLRRRLRLANGVEVRFSDEHNRAYYGNLTVCGSVWHCPICASKITSRRREALTAALQNCTLEPVLITYTLSHHITDHLPDLLTAVKESLRKVKSGRDFQWIKEDYHWVGSFVTSEVTYGDNGWHPHLHELALLSEPTNHITRNGLRVHFKREWSEALEKLGYSASWEHGVDVKHPSDFEGQAKETFGDYITKGQYWDLEAEMTKSHLKKGREGNRTPIQLLASAADGNQKDGILWREYAMAFKGRSHLRASKGLKKLLGFDAASDKDIAQEDGLIDSYRVLSTLTDYEWYLVKKAEARGELIAVAQSGSASDVQQFIESLRG